MSELTPTMAETLRQAVRDSGLSVRITGVTEGRILLTAKLKATSQVLDTYEAVVVKNLTLPFRVQLLHIGDKNPELDGALTRTIAQASANIKVANVYLRQIGVTLVADSDVKTQPAAGATALIDPAVRVKFEPLGTALIGSMPDQLADTARADAERFGPIIKALNIIGE